MPVPKPILDKPLENLKKKVEEKAQTIIDTETERLKKEAGEKLKDMLKF
jgi:hypothetical protein